MPIPEFTSEGVLPPGEHACTFAEIRDRFCNIPDYERREYLFGQLQQFIDELKAMEVANDVIVDRSFVTSRVPKPGDIDIFVVVKPEVSLDTLEAKMTRIRGRRRWFRYSDIEIFFDYQNTAHYRNIMEHFRMVDFDEDIVRGVLKVSL